MMFTGEPAIAEPQQTWEPTAKQRQAIALLATGETVKRTAKLVGVTERTLWNWRQSPDFRAAVRDTLTAVLDSAVAKLATGIPDAVDVVNRTHKGRGTVDRDRIANAHWAIERFRYLTDGLGGRPANDSQSRVTVSQSLSLAGPSADVKHLTELLLSDRDAKRSLLVESIDVAAVDQTEDSPPDGGLRPV